MYTQMYDMHKSTVIHMVYIWYTQNDVCHMYTYVLQYLYRLYTGVYI